MILLAAADIARFAPEIADQPPERASTPIAREIGRDLDVLGQQSEREAGGEGR